MALQTKGDNETISRNVSEAFENDLDNTSTTASEHSFLTHPAKVERCKTSPCDVIREYFAKWCGNQPGLFPAIPPIGILVWTFIGTFLGIAAVAATGDYAESFLVDGSGLRAHMPTAIGSFGALAVLVYGNVDSPLAQPRNVLFGNMISALIGASISQLRIFLLTTYSPTDLATDPHRYRWLAAGLSVACSHTAMQITRTVHPPGGATALTAVLGSPAINELGFMYIIAPVLTGVLTMMGVALVVNNIQRRYPLYWWMPRKLLGPETRQDIAVQNARLSHTDVKSPNYESEVMEMTKRRDMVQQLDAFKISDAVSGDDPSDHLRGVTLREQNHHIAPFDDAMILDYRGDTVEGKEMQIYLREQLRETASRIEELERRVEAVQELSAFKE